MTKAIRGAGRTDNRTPLTSRRGAEGILPRTGLSGPVNPEIAALRQRLAEDTWVGPVNARAVLLEILNLGSHLYAPDGLYVRVYASRRRLSELAGLSDDATRGALAWLEAQHWLARSEPGRGGTLGWHLGGQFRRWVDGAGVVITQMYKNTPVEKKDINLFYWGKNVHSSYVNCFDGALLGHVAETVYRALTDRRQTAAALSLDLNLDRRTVTGHLERLASVGLAEHVVKGWIKGAGTVDAAAAKLGAAAVVAGRKQKHAEERQSWQNRATQREQLQRIVDTKVDLIWMISDLDAEIERLEDFMAELVAEVKALAAQCDYAYPFGLVPPGTVMDETWADKVRAYRAELRAARRAARAEAA